MREYVVPNWHALLTHAPLGLLIMGVVLEVFTVPWRRSAARASGRWMILIGAMAAVPALTSGVYAFRDAIVHNTTGDDSFDRTWAELRETPVPDYAARPTADWPPTRPAREMLAGDVGAILRHHIWRNAPGTAAILLVVVTFIGSSDRWRRRLYVPLLLVLLGGAGLIVNAAHYGSLAVYQRGVALEPQPAARSMASMMEPTPQERVKAYLPPAQLHFTMAGWVVSFALLSLALSIRAMTQGAPEGSAADADENWFEAEHLSRGAATESDHDRAATALFDSGPDTYTAAGERRETRGGLMGTTPRRPPTVTPNPVTAVPAAHCWLLTTLVALLTAGGGLWLVNVWSWRQLRPILEGENRNLYHAIGGGSVIVLTLILALLARFARRGKVMLALFALLLVAALAQQVYVGVLMAFDGPRGPTGGVVAPLHFNPAAPADDSARGAVR